jgi:hypothetical protein
MATNPYLMKEEDVPKNWVPANASTPGGAPSSAPAPPIPHDMPQFFSGSMPPALQHDASFVSTEVGSPRIPKHALMPLGNQMNALTSAAIQSTSKIIVSQAIAAIPPAPTPAAGSPGDGLIHGDKFWEIDPAFFCIRDDFSMAPAANLGDFTSEFPWHGVNSGAGSFQSTVWPGQGFSGGMPSFGFVMMVNNSTADNANWLCPRTDPTIIPQIGWPVLDYPGWKMIWVFTVQREFHGSVPAAFSFAQTSFYMGMGNWPGISAQPSISTTPRPLDFIGLRYDTDTTAPAISDTTFVFEQVFQTPNASAPARNNAQGQTFNTGMTPTEGVTYRFEMTCGSSGSVLLSLSNGTTTSTTTFTVSPLSGLTVTNGSFSGYGLYTTSGGALFPWVPGTKVTNGSGVLTLMPGLLQPTNASWLLSSGSTSGTVSFFPALLPFTAFGNDSQATPTGSSKGIGVDYFGFIWNPAVGGGTGTSNVNLPRYW